MLAAMTVHSKQEETFNEVNLCKSNHIKYESFDTSQPLQT